MTFGITNDVQLNTIYAKSRKQEEMNVIIAVTISIQIFLSSILTQSDNEQI